MLALTMLAVYFSLPKALRPTRYRFSVITRPLAVTRPSYHVILLIIILSLMLDRLFSHSRLPTLTDAAFMSTPTATLKHEDNALFASGGEYDCVLAWIYIHRLKATFEMFFGSPQAGADV